MFQDNEEIMESHITAIPYYGNLMHPTTGFERVFFIVEQDSNNEKNQQISIGIWDSKQSKSLPGWLGMLGVEQLVCSETPDEKLQQTLQNEGVQIADNDTDATQRILKQLHIA